MTLSPELRRHAGILLIVLPTVMYGGISILSLLTAAPEYISNPLRQDLWRAGHAHAGVLLLLSLIATLLAEHAHLTRAWKMLAVTLIPLSAILLPAAFFLSVLSPDATHPSRLINLAYLGALALAAGVLILGVGLIRQVAPERP